MSTSFHSTVDFSTFPGSDEECATRIAGPEALLRSIEQQRSQGLDGDV